MNDRILVGSRKGLFLFERRGAAWDLAHVAFLGDRVSAVCADARGEHLLAALDLGHFGAKLHRSGDGGRTWAELPAPKYPERPPGLHDIEPIRKQPTPWNTELAWVLEPGVAPGRLWCGTIPGGLFRSDDGGETWALVESLWDHPSRAKWFGGGYDWPGIHSICVDPGDDRRVLVGVSCGGVWLTEDEGATWTNVGEGLVADYMPPEQRGDLEIQDPHRVVACAAAPSHMWMQHHGGVFRSRDGGRRWQQLAVPPSSFGFAVAVHPRDPETAWFAPAHSDQVRVPVDGAVVVARTRDGGRSFTALREGLPQQHAYDLVYRHALAVAADGSRLAMGSTSGSLWLSEDQGDRWRSLSTNLPPIACVRFA